MTTVNKTTKPRRDSNYPQLPGSKSLSPFLSGESVRLCENVCALVCSFIRFGLSVYRVFESTLTKKQRDLINKLLVTLPVSNPGTLALEAERLPVHHSAPWRWKTSLGQYLRECCVDNKTQVFGRPLQLKSGFCHICLSLWCYKCFFRRLVA